MAQKRMIDKKISVNEKLADLPVEAQLLFTWMIPHADDIGLLPYSSRTIKALVIPMVDMKVEQVGFHLESMIKAGLIEVFDWKKEKFYHIVKFLDNQTLKRDRKPVSIASTITEWKTVDSIWKTLETQVSNLSNKEKISNLSKEGVSAEDGGVGKNLLKEKLKSLGLKG